MGIDPGSNCTGFGIVEEIKGNLFAVHWSSIRSTTKDTFPKRLKRIYDELIIAMEKFSPDVVAVEDLFYATNAKTVIKGIGSAKGEPNTFMPKSFHKDDETTKCPDYEKITTEPRSSGASESTDCVNKNTCATTEEKNELREEGIELTTVPWISDKEN